MIIPEALENKLNDILKNAESSQFIDSSILEMKANILSELNLIDKAIVSYEYLRALKEIPGFVGIRQAEVLDFSTHDEELKLTLKLKTVRVAGDDK